MRGSKRLWRRVGIGIGVVYACIVLAFLAPRVGPFAIEDDPVIVNRIQVDFFECPADVAIVGGLSPLRHCYGVQDEVTVHMIADRTDVTADTQGSRLVMASLPTGPLRMQVSGVAPGTVDVLSCRSYAQNDGEDQVILSVVPQIAYGDEPMTASILTHPYVVSDWPTNRWVANAANPTDEQVEARRDLYVGSYICQWFLLPPGSVAERPGVVRTYTATDLAGEPLIHVLGPGGPVDGSVTNIPLSGAVPPDAFDFRSTGGGAPATTGDTWYEPYLLPAGTWVVTDRATGHTATVDVAGGQTTRVVSITAIATPQPATPAATPPG